MRRKTVNGLDGLFNMILSNSTIARASKIVQDDFEGWLADPSHREHDLSSLNA